MFLTPFKAVWVLHHLTVLNTLYFRIGYKIQLLLVHASGHNFYVENMLASEVNFGWHIYLVLSLILKTRWHMCKISIAHM